MVARIKQNEEMVNELVLAHQDYLRRIAASVKTTLSPAVDINDLVAYGQIGLIQAAKRYDQRKGASFRTYAYYRIKGAIYDGLRTMGILNRSTYKKMVMYKSINDFFIHETDKVPLAYGSDSAAKLEHMKDIISDVVIIMSMSYHTFVEYESQAKNNEPVDVYLNKELKQIIHATINGLDEKERFIINSYYFKDMNLEEIGRKLGISKSWVSRLHGKIIGKIKQRLQQQNIATE